MIILKYGSSKKILKNNPRRKHTCSKRGCKVILEEDDFKVIKVVFREDVGENDEK